MLLFFFIDFSNLLLLSRYLRLCSYSGLYMHLSQFSGHAFSFANSFVVYSLPKIAAPLKPILKDQ